MAIWRMRIACWIPRAKNSRLGCVIFIDFPLRQWLHERSSMLRSTYIASLVQHVRGNTKYIRVPQELSAQLNPKP
jgi:hypothetical protein